MDTIKTYRKIATIQAIQWDGTVEGAWRIIDHFEAGRPDIANRRLWLDSNRTFMRVRTLEGEVIATAGDWIARGVEGEVWPIKDSVFRKSYVEA